MRFDIGVQPTDASVAVYPLPLGAGKLPGASYTGAGCPMGCPGSPSMGAGAATGSYAYVADRMNAIAPLYGAPADAFDGFDWNSMGTVYNARTLLVAALNDCGVPQGEQTAILDMLPRVIEGGDIAPGTGSVDDFYNAVFGAMQTYCPDEISPGTPAITTTGTPVATTVELPAEVATPAPAPPAEEKKGLPWGWIAAGIGGVAVLGVAVYLITRPTPRRRNPSRRRTRRRSTRRSAAPRRRRNANDTYQVIMLPAAAPRPKRKRNAAPKARRKAPKAARRPKRTARRAPKRKNARAPKRKSRAARSSSKRSRARPARECTRGMEVQSLVFPSREFSSAQAKRWARAHGFTAEKIDRTSQSTRIRQHAPGGYRKGSFRTMPMGASGVQAVIACPLKGREHDKRARER